MAKGKNGWIIAVIIIILLIVFWPNIMSLIQGNGILVFNFPNGIG